MKHCKSMIGYRIYLVLPFFVVLSVISNNIRIAGYEKYGEVCLKDYMISYSYRIAPYMLLPVLALIIVLYLNRMFNVNIIVRYKKIVAFYIRLISDICKLLLIGLVIVYACIIPAGLLRCGFVADNWKDSGSYAAVVYSIMLSDISFTKLLAVEFLGFFIIEIVNALLYLIIYRFTNSLIFGYLTGIVVDFYCLLETANQNITGFYIKNTVYQSQWRYSSLAVPLLVVVIMVSAVLIMGKHEVRR